MLVRRLHWTGVVALTIAVGLLLGGLSQSVQAQEGPDLPSGWQQLSPGEFVQAVAGVRDQVALSPSELAQVQAHARTLWEPVDLASTTESYPTLNGLYELATPRFEQLHGLPDNSEQKQALETLLERVDNWAGRPYEEVRAKVFLMHWLKASQDQVMDEVRRWVAAGGTVDDIRPEDLIMMRHALSNYHQIRSSCSLRWDGTVTAPQTGNYTFSISPVNVNVQEYRHEHQFDLQQTITVSVGGQAVLTATPEEWVTQSVPVSLTAGQAVPLTYDLQVDSPRLPRFSMNALLFWEGPGVSKSIVPEASLTPPSGEGQGLQMTVTWEAEGEPQTVIQTVPAIDFAWCESRIRIFDDPAFQAQLHAAAWEKGMSNEYLDELVLSGRLHPFLFDPHLTDPIDAVACFTTAQQREFLDMLVARPSLLDPVELEQARDIYRAFRFGNPERALDIFGLWAMRHADLACIIPNGSGYFGFNYYNRRDFRQLGLCVTNELPEHAARLENEFLEMEDGSCCLPVAYSLAYSYQGQDRFGEWIALLDDKLAQEGLTGEARVNWLLARAHAQEIRLSPPEFYADGMVRPGDGLPWITEAQSAATTPATRIRVAHELAGRLTAMLKFDDARSALQEAGNGVPADVQVQVVEAIEAVTRFEEWNTAAVEQRAQLSQDNYVAKLQERRDRAASAGNTDAAARYDTLIQQATGDE